MNLEEREMQINFPLRYYDELCQCGAINNDFKANQFTVRLALNLKSCIQVR